MPPSAGSPGAEAHPPLLGRALLSIERRYWRLACSDAARAELFPPSRRRLAARPKIRTTRPTVAACPDVRRHLSFGHGLDVAVGEISAPRVTSDGEARCRWPWPR